MAVRALAEATARHPAGTDDVVLAIVGEAPLALWLLLPAAVLLAVVAPAAISFTAGQAAFTVAVVFIFDIANPAISHIGVARVEDVIAGSLIAVLVAGFLFSPAPSLAAAVKRFSRRLNPERGEELVVQAAATIRAVSRGVIGISVLQALLAGIEEGMEEIAEPASA